MLPMSLEFPGTDLRAAAPASAEESAGTAALEGTPSEIFSRKAFQREVPSKPQHGLFEASR